MDTSVVISALIGKAGPSRNVLRQCLMGELKPLMSNALFSEYEDVSSRKDIRELCPLVEPEIRGLLNALYAQGEWVSISYLWRPNLNDEGDNFLIELAIAGNANWIVTNNIKDLNNAQLCFESFKVVTPEQFLQGNQ